MAFTRQDARYEGRPLNLDEYSAVDMMADLGIHRRSSLPLQGRALIITPPPPNIYKRGPILAQIAERDAPAVAAWNSIYDPELVESREDGLGAGQMHRTGANFIPDEVRQKSPPPPTPHLRRARSVEGQEGRFEFGRRPVKAAHPRKKFESGRKISERRRDHLPDELDPEEDILAELRAESKIRMSKYRNTRPVGNIVGHHIAGNPPVVSRASRSASLLPHISPRMVPPNPLTSQWGVGTKLATAKAGYDYALHLDYKKASKLLSDPTAPQERDLNKVNKAAPPVIIFAPRIPAHLDPKTVSPVAAIFQPRLGPTEVTPTAPSRPQTAPCPNLAQLPPSTPPENSGWASNKQFSSQAEQGPTDVAGGVGGAPESESHNNTPAGSLPGTQLSPATERNRLDSEKTPSISEIPYESRQREQLDRKYVMGNTEDTDASSGFSAPPASNTSMVGAPGSTQSGGLSYNSDEGPDRMEELLVDLQAISEVVQELKARYLECGSFEATLTTRVRQIRRLKKEVLHEIKVDEDLLLGLRRKITILRAKRVAIDEELRAMEIEKAIPEINQQGEEKEQTKSTIGAELKAMISKHEALMNEHEAEEDNDVIMADIQEEEEKEKEKERGKEEEREEKEEKEEKEGPIMEDSTIKKERIEKDQVDEAYPENKQVQEKAKKLGGSYIEPERPKKEEVGKENICPQGAPTTAELFEREMVENATELLLKNHLQRDKIGRTETNIIEGRGSQQESDERVGVLSERGRTVKEADNQHDKQAEKECLESARIEKVRLDKQQLDIEHQETSRTEASRRIQECERIHAENVCFEEQQLVIEHMEKVRIQEDRPKAEHARVEEERLQKEQDEISRLEAEKLAKEIEIALFNECLDYERRGLEKKLEELERQTARNRQSRVEHPVVRPPIQFEERKVWTPTPEPSTRPVSPALSVVSAVGKPPFPYNLELDLRPMYGPHPLRVQIEQFDKPQEVILKRCNEVLGSAQYNELSQIPEFQKFLIDCNERHSRRMAKAYGNSRRS